MHIQLYDAFRKWWAQKHFTFLTSQAGSLAWPDPIFAQGRYRFQRLISLREK